MSRTAKSSEWLITKDALLHLNRSLDSSNVSVDIKHESETYAALSVNSFIHSLLFSWSFLSNAFLPSIGQCFRFSYELHVVKFAHEKERSNQIPLCLRDIAFLNTIMHGVLDCFSFD